MTGAPVSSEPQLLALIAPAAYGKAFASQLETALRSLPPGGLNADALGRALGLPVVSTAQALRAVPGAAAPPYVVGSPLRNAADLALLDAARATSTEATLFLAVSADAAKKGSLGIIPSAVERAAATLVHDGATVHRVERSRLTSGTTPPDWLESGLLRPLKERTDELKKLKAFASVNDLTLTRADEQRGTYDGRLQVQTTHFITQSLGMKVLVIHDKSLFSGQLQPGQAMRIDYNRQTGPAAHQLTPSQAKQHSR